jgi:hypothetical protein
METVTILRDLWHRRPLVGCVCLLALFCGFAVAYRISFPPKLESRHYAIGVATTRILIDTPSSQVVEVSPKGSDTLGTRAGLIASLMVDGTVKGAIARRAGVPPEQLDGVSESAAESSAAIGPPDPRASVLTTRVVTNTSGDQLPIIEVDAQAGDARAAARLAGAAVTGLRDYLDSKAALQRIRDAQRLQVTGLGAPQARDVVRGPGGLLALAAAIFVFLAGCATILVVTALARAWRAASDEEEDVQETAEPGNSRPTRAMATVRSSFDAEQADLAAGPSPPALVREGRWGGR